MNLITFGMGGRALITMGLGNAVRRMGVIRIVSREEALGTVTFTDKPWGIVVIAPEQVEFEEKEVEFKEKEVEFKEK